MSLSYAQLISKKKIFVRVGWTRNCVYMKIENEERRKISMKMFFSSNKNDWAIMFMTSRLFFSFFISFYPYHLSFTICTKQKKQENIFDDALCSILNISWVELRVFPTWNDDMKINPKQMLKRKFYFIHCQIIYKRK
jgi:hypothetical protein